MDTTRQDFLVGLFIVSAIAIVVGALIATSGWGERRYDLFLRVASAQGLTSDTKVLVEGLEIGRVRKVTPQVDPATGRVSFVARLSLIERFEKGRELRFPRSTRVEIEQLNQISEATVIRFTIPDSLRRGEGMLQAGDTINSTRRASPLDQLSDVASHLSKEVEQVLQQTHRTLQQVNQTVAALRPDMESALHDVASSVQKVNGILAKVDRAGFPDSVSATLASTNRLLRRLDSLTTSAQGFTTASLPEMRETISNLAAASRQLNHFTAEVERRPYRLFTGVKPLDERRDTTHRADPPVSAQPARDSTHP